MSAIKAELVFILCIALVSATACAAAPDKAVFERAALAVEVRRPGSVVAVVEKLSDRVTGCPNLVKVRVVDALKASQDKYTVFVPNPQDLDTNARYFFLLAQPLSTLQAESRPTPECAMRADIWVLERTQSLFAFELEGDGSESTIGTGFLRLTRPSVLMPNSAIVQFYQFDIGAEYNFERGRFEFLTAWHTVRAAAISTLR